MKLCEMEKLPDRAGFLAIVFADRHRFGVPRIIRADDQAIRQALHGMCLPESTCVILPYAENFEFTPLRDGVQFLYLANWTPWFIGTDVDGALFATSLAMQIRRIFEEGGEPAFYEALKPEAIRECETASGCEKTRRQGDIWTYPLGDDWKKIDCSRWIRTSPPDRRARWKKRRFDPILIEGKTAVFGTRHQLVGRWQTFWMSSTETRPGIPLIVGEGTLSAPDHAPLDLKGPHLIAQTAMLADPVSAD